MYTSFEVKIDLALDYFKHIFHTFFHVSKYKTAEFQMYFTLITFFRFSVIYTTKEDHAGLRMILTLLGLNFSFQVCDNRHWDDENNTWCIN